jgi:HAE1 family hydrophobic/amphiphilic exporter-1
MVSFSVRRPVTIAMTYLAVALLGVAAWRNLPIELLPDTDLPQLSISAQWPGASPETTEAFLTSPLEAAVQQVRGVEKVESESSQQDGVGNAVIRIEFARETDMEFARLDLSERLAALEKQLPAGVRGPYVQQYIPDEFQAQDIPFLSYTITGPYTLEALRAYVDDEIAPGLLQVEGVAEVTARGGRERELEIELNEARINSLGLRAEDVYKRIAELEYVQQAGKVQAGAMLRPLSIRHYNGSVADVVNAPILTRNGQVVRLRDVATVHDTYEEPRAYYRIDGRPAVAFYITREIGTNTVAVADRVKDRVAALEAQLPAGSRFFLDNDESKAIRTQLIDLRSRTILAAAIVFVVLLAFLRSFRSAAITFSTIGFSALITLNLMYFGGFTLNVLTLMGLAMGFGTIVDNAIVVLENIYRRARGGESAMVAAEQGTREVMLPIIAATMTNVVVLLPFVYLQGELQVYYVPLAVVVLFSQLASLLVGFTLVPALAARTLSLSQRRRTDGKARTRWARANGSDWYRRVLGKTIRHPWATVVVALVAFVGSYGVFHFNVNRGVLWRPWYGQDTYIAINISQPRGEELENTDRIVRFFESRLREYPEIERFVSMVSAQNANIRVTFPDSLETTEIPPAIKEALQGEGVQFGGAEVRVYGYGPSFGGGMSAPPNYAIKILGYNYEKVREIAEDIGARLQRFSRVKEVDTNSSGRMSFRDRATELVMSIDRRKLALYGLTVRDVTAQVSAAVRGATRASPIRVAGEEMLYSVKLSGYRDMDVVQLNELQIPATDGKSVRLGDVASILEKDVLNRILREDQQYQRTVGYEFRGPGKLGDRVRQAVIRNTALPPGFSIVEDEGWRWSTDEQRQIYGVLAFAVVLVFMVCAALFESVRQPICILLTVPMALIGVFLLFWLTRASFTREAYIGVIMMAGIVVNSAILLVDHVNQLRRHHGLSLKAALVRGSVERARPILMTTCTTIAGLLPLVLFSQAADANIWNALGFALIGGLLTSTVLVLTVTPALYYLFERGLEDVVVPEEGNILEGQLV